MDIKVLKDYKFIVLCRDHNNPLGLCWSLVEEGINPIVVLIGRNPILVNHSKRIKTLIRVNTPEEGLKYIMDKYGNEEKKPFLLTGQDELVELLDQHYDELIDKFYFYHDGKQGLITYNNQKHVQCDIAEVCGIQSPKRVVLKRGELPKNLKYPVLTKAILTTKGAWKKDVHICNSEDELKNAWKSIEADEIMVQEYIEKKNELCIDGFSINGGEEVFLSYTSEYIRFTPKGFGNYMWFKQYGNDVIKEKIKQIIRKVHYTGIFCIECIIDKNDVLYFLEVNYRYSGWGYAHTYGGVNLPVLWAKSLIKGYIDTSEITLRANPFTAMDEFMDFRESVKSGKISFFNWYKQFRSCDVCFTFNKEDISPFLYELKDMVGRVIKRALHLSKSIE